MLKITFLSEIFALMLLSLSISAINALKWPTSRLQDGKLFESIFQMTLRPIQMMTNVSVLLSPVLCVLENNVLDRIRGKGPKLLSLILFLLVALCLLPIPTLRVIFVPTGNSAPNLQTSVFSAARLDTGERTAQNNESPTNINDEYFHCSDYSNDLCGINLCTKKFE